MKEQTTQTQHTPTPWAIRNGSHYDYIHAPTETAPEIGRFVARIPDDEQGKADAAHIVHCVNSHESLLAENKRLREALTGFLAHIEPYMFESEAMADAHATARAVLAETQP